jgi:hypothetical protein
LHRGCASVVLSCAVGLKFMCKTTANTTITATDGRETAPEAAGAESSKEGFDRRAARGYENNR